MRPKYRKRGSLKNFTRDCESQTSDLAFAVQTEQNDRADLVAQSSATTKTLRTKIERLCTMWRSTADLKVASAIRTNKQILVILSGVKVGDDDHDVGASDQDVTFGYSSDETEGVTPLTHSMSTRLEKNWLVYARMLIFGGCVQTARRR